MHQLRVRARAPPHLRAKAVDCLLDLGDGDLRVSYMYPVSRISSEANREHRQDDERQQRLPSRVAQYPSPAFAPSFPRQRNALSSFSSSHGGPSLNHLVELEKRHENGKRDAAHDGAHDHDQKRLEDRRHGADTHFDLLIVGVGHVQKHFF